MKRIVLFLLFSAMCGLLYAQSSEYSYRIMNDSGYGVKRASLFVECGKSDENGCFKIKAKFNKNLLIEVDGYQRSGLVLKAEPIQRVTPIPLSGEKKSLSYPEVLNTKYEYPLYVVNGVYVPSFRKHNYSDEMISSVTTINKWNKVTKPIFKDTDIESIDVVKRGVVMVTTTEEINFNTPKKSIEYTVIVVDGEGKPIEGATIYSKRGSTDDGGYIDFEAQTGERAVITAGKYKEYSFTLPEHNSATITMQKREQESQPKVRMMPTFNGGGISNFRSWLLSYIHEDIMKCRQDTNTAVEATFVVGRSGKVVCVDITKQNNPRAAQIVKRAIYSSPKWSPAIQNGKPVNIRFTIPVHIIAGYD